MKKKIIVGVIGSLLMSSTIALTDDSKEMESKNSINLEETKFSELDDKFNLEGKITDSKANYYQMGC